MSLVLFRIYFRIAKKAPGTGYRPEAVKKGSGGGLRTLKTLKPCSFDAILFRGSPHFLRFNIVLQQYYASVKRSFFTKKQ